MLDSVLGAESGAVSKTGQVPALWSLYAVGSQRKGPGAGGGGVKYKVCRMAISTMEKNKAGKGFAIVNRVE